MMQHYNLLQVLLNFLKNPCDYFHLCDVTMWRNVPHLSSFVCRPLGFSLIYCMSLLKVVVFVRFFLEASVPLRMTIAVGLDASALCFIVSLLLRLVLNLFLPLWITLD